MPVDFLTLTWHLNLKSPCSTFLLCFRTQSKCFQFALHKVFPFPEFLVPSVFWQFQLRCFLILRPSLQFELSPLQPFTPSFLALLISSQSTLSFLLPPSPLSTVSLSLLFPTRVLIIIKLLLKFAFFHRQFRLSDFLVDSKIQAFLSEVTQAI